MTTRFRPVAYLAACLMLLATLATARGESAAPAVSIQPIKFEKETLPNGLRVIYAPMDNAPVVHVRVIYHVGSRDERSDRRGFAHMFEHMMFTGSKHVEGDDHGKLIGITGGNSNAFTAFDQTTYINTIPNNQLEMTLWLEADRMASYKVNKTVFAAERNVVAEEWRLRYANAPYGSLFEDFLSLAFKKHNYRWMPIGDMDELRQSTVAELQEFWNTYYIPNNACLVIAGDIDVAKTKEMVHRFFAWIPRGPEIKRLTEPEPQQTDTRRLEVYKRDIPIPITIIGFKTGTYDSPDTVALEVLASVVGGGRSSRLSRLLVTGDNPQCIQANVLNQQLQDAGILACVAAMLPGKDSAKVEESIISALKDVVEHGITQEELDKVRAERRIGVIRGRETCVGVATELGENEVFAGDANRANEDVARLDSLTVADVQAVAKKYLNFDAMNVLHYIPDPLGKNSKPVEDKSAGMKTAAVVDDGRVVEPRAAEFPADHPTTPPMSKETLAVKFKKGEEIDVNGLKVIVMSDHRLPLVTWSLIFRGGGDAEPVGKEGLSSLATQMVRRGVAGATFQQLNEELESRGTSIEVVDADDNTRLTGQTTVDQLDHAIGRSVDLLARATFPADEFEKLRDQALAGLKENLADPANVAGRELSIAMWSPAPAGRVQTAQSLRAITLDDTKKWIESVFRKDGAFLVFSGDITTERARALAEKIAAVIPAGTPPVADYTLPAPSLSRRIILVDNADGKQANIRMSVRAYTNKSDEKYAGGIVNRILSDGVESRLNKYVRAEKGLSYGVTGVFIANRHTGAFNGSTDTNPETVAASIEAMWKVFNDMKQADVDAKELAESKNRINGGWALEMQTIGQQTSRRVDIVLNGYPLDYYDTYPQKIDAVSATQIKDLVGKYVDPERMTIVVVGPAKIVKPQLDPLGPVEVIEMPLKRKDSGFEDEGLLGNLGGLFRKKPATQPAS